MPISKKQLQRLIRLVSQLKENRYPNCSTFAAAMRKADLDENLNVSCTPKTIFRDIQTLKNDFDAPIKFDKVRAIYGVKWTPVNIVSFPIAIFNPGETEVRGILLSTGVAMAKTDEALFSSSFHYAKASYFHFII